MKKITAYYIEIIIIVKEGRNREEDCKKYYRDKY